LNSCDKCKDFYHFSCCVPPLTSFPKRRDYGWTCHRCNEESEHEHSEEIKSNKVLILFIRGDLHVYLLEFQT